MFYQCSPVTYQFQKEQGMEDNPEIGRFADTCGYRTNYHDHGSGPVMLVLHGSGAGVCAWANWRSFIPALQDRFRIIAPDLVGFGYTETPADYQFRFMDSWVDQIIALLDQLEVAKAHVVGNSFGGSLALWLAWKHPDRFDRLVLMGPGGLAGAGQRESRTAVELRADC